MNAILENLTQSGNLQSFFLPPLIVIALILFVFIGFFRKPTPPPFVFDYDSSIPFAKKQKKKTASKPEKKVKLVNTKPAESKEVQKPSRPSEPNSASEVTRPAPAIFRRPAASNSTSEDAGDWFEVTSGGKRKVVIPAPKSAPPSSTTKTSKESKDTSVKAAGQPTAKKESIKTPAKSKEANKAASSSKNSNKKVEQAKEVFNNALDDGPINKPEPKEASKKAEVQESSKASTVPKGDSKKSAEAKGDNKKSAEAKGDNKKSAEAKGDNKKSAEAKEESKKLSEAAAKGKGKSAAASAKAPATKDKADVKSAAANKAPAQAKDASQMHDSGIGSSFVEVESSKVEKERKKDKSKISKTKQAVEVDGFVLAEYSPPSSASTSPPISQQSDTIQIESVTDEPAAGESIEADNPSNTSGSAKKRLKRTQKVSKPSEAKGSKPAPPQVAAAPKAPAEGAAQADEAAWLEVPASRKRRVRRDA